jgi:DNA-binding NarL/FixJ family response regulator
MTKEITIVLADDHPIVRQGLRQIIEEDGRLRVVAEANDGQEAFEAIESLEPDVAVLDIDMPQANGFEVARRIEKHSISTRLIFLTMHNDEDIFNSAVDLGAKGFILKDSAVNEIVECIKAVAQNENFVSHSLTTYLMNRTKRAIGLARKQPSISDLTPTELQILKLIAEDLQTKEIAEKLFISPRTVDKHRSNICRKLDLKGIHSLFKFAVLNKSKLL